MDAKENKKYLFYLNNVDLKDEITYKQCSVLPAPNDTHGQLPVTTVSGDGTRSVKDKSISLKRLPQKKNDHDKIEPAPLEKSSTGSVGSGLARILIQRHSCNTFTTTAGSAVSARKVSFSDMSLCGDDDVDDVPYTSSGSAKTSRNAPTLHRIDQSAFTKQEDGQFKVTFFNKFGRKGTAVEAFIDASSVSYIYNGAVLVTDMLGSKIVLYSRSGRPEKNFVTGEYTEPWSAVLTPRGYIAVTLRRHHCVAIWSGSGDTMAEFGHKYLQCPTGLAVDKDGRYIVTDEQANEVYIFSANRTFLCAVGEKSGVKFKQPRHVCLSTTGRIIVSDSGHHCVKVFDKEGRFVRQFGEYGSGSGQFKFPYGVCVDQDGNIIVSDHYNDRVSMFYSDGTFMQHLVTAKRPRGVAVRCAHNRKLYVTHGELRATEVLVFKMTPNGTKVTINVKSFV